MGIQRDRASSSIPFDLSMLHAREFDQFWLAHLQLGCAWRLDGGGGGSGPCIRPLFRLPITQRRVVALSVVLALAAAPEAREERAVHGGGAYPTRCQHKSFPIRYSPHDPLSSVLHPRIPTRFSQGF